MNSTEGVTQKYLDEKNFDLQFIREAERIYGPTWLSPGGEAQTKAFLTTLGLSPGQRVLDLGSGLGGAAILMARCYGVHVHGVDISTNMHHVAQEYLALQEKKVQDLVRFEIADIREMQLEAQSFDVIFSRDSILYVEDKASLFEKMQGWLRPGGRLYFSDFCRGTSAEPSQELKNLVKLRRYCINWTLVDYKEGLQKTGFKDVRAHDLTNIFVKLQTEELKFLASMRECYIQDFGEEAYNEFVWFWKNLLGANQTGALAWALFEALK